MATIRRLLRTTLVILLTAPALGRAADKLKVVATTADLAAVARAVGGDNVEGASLEAGWLPPILDSARNPRVSAGAPGRVVAAQGIPLLEVPTQLDRSMGDVHPQGNPHFMLDPVAAKTVAHSIQTAFCAVDGARCPDYEAGLRRFRDTVDAKLAAWQAALAPLKGTKVVTYHKDFDYFFERF